MPKPNPRQIFLRRSVPLLLLGIVMLAVVAPPGCDRSNGAGGRSTATDGPPAPPRRPTTRQVESEIVASLASPLTAEARGWLAEKFDETHVVWKRWDKDEAREQVAALYEAGAVKVWVADPTPVEKSPAEKTLVAVQFVIELPTDAKTRVALFEWIENWERDLEQDERTTDRNQRYYEINLDQ